MGERLIMWLAMILACANPSALSCNIIANKQKIFKSESECMDEVVIVQKGFLDRGVYALPYCFEIKTGTSI